MTILDDDKRQGECSEERSSVESGAQECTVSNQLFVQTVKENYAVYAGKCYAYLKCERLAEDAVQEGVLAAHKNLASVKNADALGSWLYRIIIRKCIDLLYKEQKSPLFSGDMEELLSYNQHGLLNGPMWAETADPEQEILKSEGLEQVRKAVELLAHEYRIPLLLKDFEGFSIREIAGILQISESNAKVRIHRGRIKLKQQLDGYFFPEYTEGKE